jgi:hypothetical protein
MARPIPAELGDRVLTRRMVPLPVAALVCLAPGLVISSLFLLRGPDAFAFAAAIVVPWSTLLTWGILGEVLGYRHHVHEHGVLTESTRPFPRYVVPFYTVPPESVVAGEPERTDGTMRDSRDPRRRQAPGRPALLLTGLAPDRARLLAKGRASWTSAPYRLNDPSEPGHGQREAEPVRWVLGWPPGSLAQDRDLVERLARASRATDFMTLPDEREDLHD